MVASVEEFRASQWGFLYPSAHSQEVADRTALPLGNPVRLLYFQLTPTAIRFLRTLSHVYDLDETEEMPSGLYWLADLLSTSRGTVSSPPDGARVCGIDRAVLDLFQTSEAAAKSQKG